MARDDFSQKTKEILAKRVGYRCSNPCCGCATVFPGNEDKLNVAVIGQAAHITAASPGGPRYDASMTAEERSSIENGIWLCNKCARLIDVDEKDYPAEMLHQWKMNAEEQQRRGTAIYGYDTDRARRLEIEKDFRDIHTFIVNNDLRCAPLDFFVTVDVLYEKYISDSFFAKSSLLIILNEMAGILAMKTSPSYPVIPSDDPIMDELFKYRKCFSEEYKKLFFV